MTINHIPGGGSAVENKLLVETVYNKITKSLHSLNPYS